MSRFKNEDVVMLINAQPLNSIMDYYHDDLNLTTERHPCPWCRSDKSFALYDTEFHCFACQKHGSVLDYIILKEECNFEKGLCIGAEIFELPNPGEAIDEVTRIELDERKKNARDRKKKRNKKKEKEQSLKMKMAAIDFKNAEPLNEGMACLKYFKIRGIPLQEIPLNVRWDDYGRQSVLICPFQNDSGDVVGVHKTFLNRGFFNVKVGKEEKKSNKRQMNGSCCYLIELYTNPDSRVAFIGEGLEPTIAGRNLFGSKYTYFMAASSGILAKASFPENRFDEVFILADNDEAGLTAAEKFADKLAIKTQILKVDKDWDEIESPSMFDLIGLFSGWRVES